MSSKTPVSVLQELMMRKGHTPQYELIEDGTGTHEPVFKYKVVAGTVSAIGIGRAKKEAKHDAARRALERISDSEPNLTDIESPYKDKTQENSVGMLLDLCAVHNLPAPEFDVILEVGPPHAKQFTIACSVSKNQKIATGRTKKQAKQLAAQKLLTKLKESLGDISVDETLHKREKISDEELLKKLELLGKSVAADPKHHLNPKSYGYKLPEAIHLLKDVTSETLEKLRNNELSIEEKPNDLVVDIANELNADLSTEVIQTVKECNNVYVVMKMDLILSVCEYGKGTTEYEAFYNASVAMIRYLLFMSESKNE